MRPSFALSPPSIYFSPKRGITSMRSTDLGHATFFIFRSSLLQNNHALSLPPPLSLCLHHARFRSCYSYDLWTNDPRGISPKDWPNRDSTPSCPSRWHCVSSCNADYSLSWTGHGRTRSKGWECIFDGVSDYDDTHGFDGKRSENSHSSNRSSIDCVCKAT